MNGRSVSSVLLAVWLSGSGLAFAESEAKEDGEAEVSSFAAPEVQLDFRSGRMGEDAFGSSGGAFTAFGIGMFAAAGADLVSTEVGLRQPGVYESNPLQGNRGVRIVTHAAAPAFMYWVTDRMHKKGKTKLALITRIGFSVAYSYAVMHNVRTSASAP